MYNITKLFPPKSPTFSISDYFSLPNSFACQKNEWMPHDTFANFKNDFEKVDRTFLTDIELSKLIKLNLSDAA